MDRSMVLMDGSLLNTVFVLYAPDGETRLSRPARSPRLAFAGRDIVESLHRIADGYPDRQPDAPAHTPDFSAVREAINFAACDGRPLVLAYGPDAETCAAYEAQLRALAWSPDFIGRVHWDFAHDDAAELRAFVPDLPDTEAGVVILQPEPFGRSAAVIGTLDPSAPLADQQAALHGALDTFAATFEKLPYEAHVAAGHDQGITWEEAIRMSDRPMSDQRRRRNPDNPRARRDRNAPETP